MRSSAFGLRCCTGDPSVARAARGIFDSSLLLSAAFPERGSRVTPFPVRLYGGALATLGCRQLALSIHQVSRNFGRDDMND